MYCPVTYGNIQDKLGSGPGNSSTAKKEDLRGLGKGRTRMGIQKKIPEVSGLRQEWDWARGPHVTCREKFHEKLGKTSRRKEGPVQSQGCSQKMSEIS